MSGTGKPIASAAALAAVGRHELAALGNVLGAARPGDSVHGARRRIKQLRSLLRLLRPCLDGAAFAGTDDALRAAADALAGHRRAEALVAAAGKLESGKTQAGFWRDVAHAHRAAHAAEGDPAAALAEARTAIAAAAGQLGGASLRPDSDAAISEAFLATYAKARKRLRSGLKSGDATRLHEARKVVIHHLHQLSLLHPRRTRRLGALEGLREILGDLNDLDELEQIAPDATVSARDRRRMRKARKELLGRAGKAARRLFRRKPRRFARRLGHAPAARSPRRPVALQAVE
ncbi:CHAD domain-containing protein [Aestuariivirga sp.]|uniref:CHAD domain-containing protein n=1 Tax=Aestuariivirga sp. TaxID=2650926 RepID=UPI0035B3AADF